MSRASSRLRPSHSRPHHSRHSSAASGAYLPYNPDSLIHPEGQIGESEADLLHDLVHPNHPRTRFRDSEDTLEEDDEQLGSPNTPEDLEEEEDYEQMMQRPWYHRPSAWWYV